MIAVINYHMGNLQSVANVLEYLKVSAVITNDAAALQAADKLILPGVGAFPEAMKNLRALGLVEVIREMALQKRRPFLGICLGMQLLSDRGFEGRETPGLGLIPGEVRRLEPADPELRLPHIGWNDVEPAAGSALYGSDRRRRVFYFVHSYHFVCRDDAAVSGYADYGGRFAASVERGNIFGTQFHPEKSQTDGLELLRNFVAYMPG